jgi:trehalose 6-phosphate phosphatase
MMHLLESWSEVARRLSPSRAVALFLDFDGTLSPITGRPEDASLERGTRTVLSRLAANRRVRVCVISGRRRADLHARVAVPGIDYLGVHGWETDGGGFSPELMRLVAEARRGLASRLNGTLSGIRGVQIEDKGASFALHYRGASNRIIGQARALLEETLAERDEGVPRGPGGPPHLRVLEGDRVWEVVPREVRGKGYAARKQWRRWGMSALPVYLGNDATDEAAFQALAGGVTVRVGLPRRSRALYRLRNPAEVRRFLEMLEEEMRWQQHRGSNS